MLNSPGTLAHNGDFSGDTSNLGNLGDSCGRLVREGAGRKVFYVASRASDSLKST